MEKIKEKTIFGIDLEKSVTPDRVRVAQNILGRHFDIVSYEQVDLKEEICHNDVHFFDRCGRHNHVDLKHYSEGTWNSRIALEVHNDVTSKSAGWVFKLINEKVDYVLFIWHGKAKLCYLLVYADKLEKWWRENYRRYPLILNKISVDRKTGNEWQSSFCSVKIMDLPKDLILCWQRFTDLSDFMNVRQIKLG